MSDESTTYQPYQALVAKVCSAAAVSLLQAPAPPTNPPSGGGGTTPSAPPGTPGTPGSNPPSGSYPGAPETPGGLGPDGNPETSAPAGPLGQLGTNLKAIGIGSAFAGVALVGAAAFVVLTRKRRRLMPALFTDLSSITTGPTDDPRVIRQISKRHRGAAATAGVGAPELQSLVGTSSAAAAAGELRGDLTTSPRAKAALGEGMRSLKNIFSGKWGLRAARSGDGAVETSEDGRVVLPGAVAARDLKGARSAFAGAAQQGTADDGDKVVGSPRVQPSMTTRDSLRQRHGGQQQPEVESLLSDPGQLGVAAAGAAPSTGAATKQQQQPEEQQLPGDRGRQKLPPIRGSQPWRPSG